MIKILQLLCYNFFSNNKETLATHVTWKSHPVIAKFRIFKIRLKRKPFFWTLVTEVLIFRGRRSQRFFKIDTVKNFAILEPFLIMLNTFFYRTLNGSCFRIFQAADTFSAKSGIYWRKSHRFSSRTPLKTRLKPWNVLTSSSHCSCSAKKVFLEIL